MTVAAQAGDLERVKTLEAAFAPLWTLFKEFGSFRVMYVIAAVLGIGTFDPPRPVLNLSSDARNGVKNAVDILKAAQI